MNDAPLAAVPAPSGKWLTFLTLFTSTGTLLCCALPALLVALGAGAALSTLVAVVPGLVWVSEYKEVVFGVAAGVWFPPGRPCPGLPLAPPPLAPPPPGHVAPPSPHPRAPHTAAPRR